MAETITDQLLRFAGTEVPDDAAAMMRLCLFDWAVCGVAGAREGSFAAFSQGEAARNPGMASLLGGGQAHAASAALINGTLSHALDFDDTHFDHIGHPSVAVVPAMLALAEEEGLGLQAVTEAAAIGVEASIHVGVWLGRGHYQVGYHQTATAGAFGATLGACRLLGLDTETTRRALGLCASMASGIKAQFGTMGKPLNAGLAARSGVEAARWAQAGMTSAYDGLAGPLGFGPTHHGAGEAVALPGPEWRILQISHKFHACCHGLHAMLEALVPAQLGAEDVAKMTVHTHPRWMSVCNIPDPTTGLEAKFSYRHTAAMQLAGHDTGDTENFTDALAGDPVLTGLRGRVEVREDAGLSETQARIEVQMQGGAMRELAHDLRAQPDLAVLAEKLRRKGRALLGDAEPLWQAVQGDDLPGFAALLVQ